MNGTLRWSKNFTILSLLCLALFIFTSISLSALSHIFIVIPVLLIFLRPGAKFDIALSYSAKFLLAFIIFSCISVLVNWELYDHPVKYLFKVKYFLIGFLAIFAYQKYFENYNDSHDKTVKVLLHLFIISTTLATLSGLIALYSGFNILKWKEACHPVRACGMYGMTITYGYGIQFFCILLLGMIVHYKKIERFVSWQIISSSLAINLLGLYLSYARGALVGFLVALPFFFYRKKKVFMPMMITLTIFFGFGLYYVFYGSSVNRYLKDYKSPGNIIRISQYTAAFQAFLDNPVFGLGFRNFESQSVKIKQKYNIIRTEWGGHAHNNLLEVLSGTGLSGFLLFIGFIFFWLYELLKKNNVLSSIFVPFWVAFFVSGLFQSTIIDGENMFLIMLIYGISQIHFDQSSRAGER